jgi:hypothetical protein
MCGSVILESLSHPSLVEIRFLVTCPQSGPWAQLNMMFYSNVPVLLNFPSL